MTNEEIDKIASRMSIRKINTPRDETQCAICNKIPEWYGNGYIMPFGSIHDGRYVCEECLIGLLDPAIPRVAISANP